MCLNINTHYLFDLNVELFVKVQIIRCSYFWMCTYFSFSYLRQSQIIHFLLFAMSPILLSLYKIKNLEIFAKKDMNNYQANNPLSLLT
jgi:hypothetical protein